MLNFKKKPPATKAGLTACLPGYQIAEFAPIKRYFIEIRNLVSAAQEVYDEFYLSTLYRLAEFCQSMPFSEAHFNVPYGVLIRQLTLTVAVLKIRGGKLLPKNSGAETIAAEEATWTYALFSASLLSDLYSVQYDRKVTLHHANGDLAGTWVPLSGSLYEKTRYYSLEFKKQETETSEAIFMAALSGRIVPPTAVRWLANTPLLYPAWWKTLLQENDKGPVLQEIIEEAAKKAETFLPKNEVKVTESIDGSNALEELAAWLIKKKNENLEQVFQVQQGFFVGETMLNDFLSEAAKADKAQFLQSLMKSGHLILKGNDFYHSLAPIKFEDRRLLNGIMLNRDFLPEALQKLPISNDFKANVSL